MFTIGPYLVILRKGEAVTNKVGKIAIIMGTLGHEVAIILIGIVINTIFIGKTKEDVERGRKTGDLQNTVYFE